MRRTFLCVFLRRHSTGVRCSLDGSGGVGCRKRGEEPACGGPGEPIAETRGVGVCGPGEMDEEGVIWQNSGDRDAVMSDPDSVSL